MSIVLALAAAVLGAGEPVHFEKRVLSDRFVAEGANAGDFNGDGNVDVVALPWIFLGPDFDHRVSVEEVKECDPHAYSNHFLTFVEDLNGDRRPDIIDVPIAGAAVTWLETPARLDDVESIWTRHVLFPVVDNEAPGFADVDGDGKLDLYFHTGGRFGYATRAKDPLAPWTFHPISEDLGLINFVHGLGCGDVNGDGRPDLLEKNGVWLQPKDGVGSWTKVAAALSSGRQGGAQMFATDLDGDSDADVIASLDGHGFGLSWFEQTKGEGGMTFVEHRILDDSAEKSAGGLRLAEMHALALADIDQDGLQDIVTGKRHWAHGPDADPMPGSPARLVWLRQLRDEKGTRFEPHVIDEDSGVGTQVVVADVSGDRKPDVVVANKRGVFILFGR